MGLLYQLKKKITWQSSCQVVELREVLKHRKQYITIDEDTLYKRCRVQLYGKGVALRDEVPGAVIKTKKQQLCRPQDFLVAEIDAKFGGYGIVPDDLNDAIVSSHYFLFEIDQQQLMPDFLGLILKSEQFASQVQATGSTNYSAIRPHHVLGYLIPLPTLPEQAQLVAAHQARIQAALSKRDEAAAADLIAATALLTELGLKSHGPKQRRKGLYFVESKDVREWGIDKIGNSINYQSSKWPSATLDTQPELSSIVFRGKSPVYAASDVFMLNQKCIRWNSIEVKHAKTVSADWLAGIDSSFLTQEDDVLINSTGEGTIGRAAVITQATVGYLVDTHVLVARLDTSKINAYLWTEIINSPHGQQQINEIKSAQTTKQTELGTANLKRIVFPLPPLAKQDELADLLRQTKAEALRLREDAKALESEAVAAFEAAIFQ